MEWVFRYVLPSLMITTAFESKYVIIAPFDDPRTQQAISRQSNATRLLTGFINRRSKQIKPAALLVLSNAPESAASVEALVAFRNLCAISTLLRHWAHSTNEWRPAMLFSDHFDFYPYTVSENNRIICINPDISSYGSEDAPFIGMASPLLALMPGPVLCDDLLFRTLLRQWEKKFVSPCATSKYTSILFRSLELAYQALSIPIKNQASIHDFGVSVACWVSAFEILVHLKHAEANSRIVRQKLLTAEYPLSEKKLSRHYITKVGKKQNKEKLPFIQKTYEDIYRVRNDFMHGNKVTAQTLFPFGTKKPAIIRLAPTIYRIALWHYLHPHFYKRDRYVTDFIWLRDYEVYENSLMQVFSSNTVSAES